MVRPSDLLVRCFVSRTAHAGPACRREPDLLARLRGIARDQHLHQRQARPRAPSLPACRASLFAERLARRVLLAPSGWLAEPRLLAELLACRACCRGVACLLSPRSLRSSVPVEPARCGAACLPNPGCLQNCLLAQPTCLRRLSARRATLPASCRVGLPAEPNLLARPRTRPAPTAAPVRDQHPPLPPPELTTARAYLLAGPARLLSPPIAGLPLAGPLCAPAGLFGGCPSRLLNLPKSKALPECSSGLAPHPSQPA